MLPICPKEQVLSILAFPRGRRENHEFLYHPICSLLSQCAPEAVAEASFGLNSIPRGKWKPPHFWKAVLTKALWRSLLRLQECWAESQEPSIRHLLPWDAITFPFLLLQASQLTRLVH